MNNYEKNMKLYSSEFMDLLISYRLEKDTNKAIDKGVEIINWIKNNYE